MPVCPPRRESIVGAFKAGELKVGERTYADALCGVPICGDAICGAWWVEPCNPALQLGGYLPTVTAADILPPPAGLGFSARLPALIIQTQVSVPAAALALGAVAPGLQISLHVVVPSAALGLGGYVPEFAGSKLFEPAFCIPLVLDPASCDAPVGGPVELWPDASGNGHDGVIVGAPVPVLSPAVLNGLPVVRFAAGQGRLLVSGSGVTLDYTVLYVSRMIGPGVGRVLGAETGGDQNLVLGYYGSGYEAMFDQAWIGGVPDPEGGSPYPPLPTDWRLYEGDRTNAPPSSPRFFIDGVFIGSVSPGVSVGGFGDTLTLSGHQGGQTCDCEVAEVLVFNRVLSDLERGQLESYLREKWGLGAGAISDPLSIAGLTVWFDATQLDVGGSMLTPVGVDDLVLTPAAA